MRRISCFVITIINHDILERLVGDFMIALLRVEEVVLVVLHTLGLITLQPLIKLLLQALVLLSAGLLARKNWKPSVS
jgi:hypothetical protein